jgi:TldD protein
LLQIGGAAAFGAAARWPVPTLAFASDAVGPAGDLDRLAIWLGEAVAELEGKFPYASALYTSQQGIQFTRDRRGKGLREARGRGAGVSLRVFDGSAFHERAIDEPNHEAIVGAARALRGEVARAVDRMEILPLPPLTQSWVTPMEIDPDTTSLTERVARLDEEYERFAWPDERLKNMRLNSEQSRVERVFVDRTRRLTSRRWLITQSIILIGREGDRSAVCVRQHGGQGGLELTRLPAEEIEASRRELIDLLGAEPPPVGEVDVVLDPHVSGLLAHESFGHGVESDLFVSERARARLFLGKTVAAPVVNLSDDPSIAGARGSYPFDDEGMLSGRTRIIENGIFRRPLTDLSAASELGLARSANGRAQAFDRKVYVRMSNTFFEPGTSDPAEMLAGLEDGLYVQGFRNGIEDPQGWGIQFTAHLAREYKRGKPTGRVFAPITVTGYVPEILAGIRAVGRDFRLRSAGCGKGFKEFVPVSAGGPHLRTRARIS